MMRTFTMTEKEVQQAEAWKDGHRECSMRRAYETAKAAIAVDPFSYEFQQNSVAYSVVVRCVCGAKEDVTDVEQW